MTGNKKRLYIGMYPSGVRNSTERKYHWSLLVGPKNEGYNPVTHPSPGKKYHVKNRPIVGWLYEEIDEPAVQDAPNLLGRLLIAKLENVDRFEEIVRGTPVIQNNPEWYCRQYIRDVLVRLADDCNSSNANKAAVGRAAVLDWETIEAQGREYIDRKTNEGRYREITEVKPLWDMLAKKEIVP